mgnify:CR=1 FL=1
MGKILDLFTAFRQAEPKERELHFDRWEPKEEEKPEFVDANMSMEELMKTEDPDRNYRLVSYRDDTCAMYSFFDPMTESQRGTPRDQSAWVLEEFPDRPNAVRWTYRITDKDYKEAVRQTLERWADRDEE